MSKKQGTEIESTEVVEQETETLDTEVEETEVETEVTEEVEEEVETEVETTVETGAETPGAAKKFTAAAVDAEELLGEHEETPGADTLDLNNEALVAQILTDPVGFRKELASTLTKEIVANLNKQSQTKSQREDFRKEFFAANEDLQEATELVDMVSDRLRKEWKRENKKLSGQEAAEILAVESRKLLKKYRGDETNVSAVETGKKKVTVASGKQNAPKVTVEKTKPQTFAQQMQTYRAGKGAVRS